MCHFKYSKMLKKCFASVFVQKIISLCVYKDCLIVSNSCLHQQYIQWLIHRIPKGRLSYIKVSKMQAKVESAL